MFETLQALEQLFLQREGAKTRGNGVEMRGEQSTARRERETIKGESCIASPHPIPTTLYASPHLLSVLSRRKGFSACVRSRERER